MLKRPMSAKLLLPSFVVLLAGSSCVTGPDITPCVYSNPDRGSWCAPKVGDVYFKANEEMDNYTAFSPDDTEKLVNWMKLNCSGPKKGAK